MVESMTYYGHMDVEFRGEEVGIEYETHGGELEDWSFEGMNADEYKALHLTQDENEALQRKILDHMSGE